MTNSDDPTNDRAARIADSIRGQESDQDDGQPRREFLTNSAVAGGALLALGGSAGLAIAQEDGEGEGENGMPDDEAAFDDVEGTDIDVLNYALSLEHLEAAFYRQATEQFSEADFQDADSLSQFNEEMRSMAWEYVQVVGEHEATHVEVLTQAVTLLGGEPAEAGDYDFGVESVEDFLTLASVLENTGVAAYAGAAPFVQSPDLLASALSIHSVEARHAAVFNMLTGQSPSPNAFDEAASQQEVLDVVEQFVADSGEPTDETPDETEPGNGTDTDNGTDMPNGTEPGNGTDVPNGTEPGNGTDVPNGTEPGNGTDMPNGTDTPSGQ